MKKILFVLCLCLVSVGYGQCISGDCVNGKGTFTWAASGNKYVGEWKDAKCHGQGTLIYLNGDKYVGEWKDDKMHGQGTFTYANGENYVGGWKEDFKHGQGTFTYANGNKDVREWKGGKKNEIDCLD